MSIAEVRATPLRPTAWTCLCHFPSGADGVYYVVVREQLLRGTQTVITGLPGVWTVTEMIAPDEGEVIDAEIWVRPATDEELTSSSRQGDLDEG